MPLLEIGGAIMDSKKRMIHTEHKIEMEYRGEALSGDIAAVRKTIEEAAKRIPDAALKSLKSFRLVLLA